MPTRARNARAPVSRGRLTKVSDRIVTVRGVRVVLDRDLAELYDVSTKALNQAIARNRTRFPADFCFRLTSGETSHLRSQSVTSSFHGGLRYAPRAFTEHGIAMLSSVLRSRRAVAANVAIMRAFVRLRAVAHTHADLTHKLADLERKYDGKFAVVFSAIRRIVVQPLEVEEPRRRIGFVVDALPPARLRSTARQRSG